MKKFVLFLGILSLTLILINIGLSQKITLSTSRLTEESSPLLTTNLFKTLGEPIEVYENQYFGFGFTCYWDPPHPEIPICVWATELPPGSSFPTTSGYGSVSSTFSWQPTYCQAGSYAPVFHCGETCGSALITQPVEITVNNVNRNPTITINPSGSVNVTAGEEIHVDISATDPDYSDCHDNTLALTYNMSYTPSLTPSLVDYYNGNGYFDWTTTALDNGTHEVDFNVKDNLNGFDFERLTANIKTEYGNILSQTHDNVVNFTYNVSCKENCTKIVFMQVFYAYVGRTDGLINYTPPSMGNPIFKYLDDNAIKVGDISYVVDRGPGFNTPFYGMKDDGTPTKHTQPGKKIPGNPIIDAKMSDDPVRSDAAMNRLNSTVAGGKLKNITMVFETCAYCAEGADAGKYYDCISWQWSKDKPGLGTSTITDTNYSPSTNFLNAVKLWANKHNVVLPG